MSRVVSVLSLLVALGALALAWQAGSELDELRSELATQQATLALQGEVASYLRPTPSRASDGLALPGRAAVSAAESSVAGSMAAPALQGLAPPPGAPSGAHPPGTEGELDRLVDRAVDARVEGAFDEAVRKGVRHALALQDKTPAYATFSEVLGLEEAQGKRVAHDIQQAQAAIVQVLKQPADDGTVFYDRLVDLMVEGARKPGQAVGWKAFIERVVGEPVPGSNTTYGARIDGIKGDLAQSLRRTMDDRQWASFQAWQLDPTQVRDVPGSPYAEIQRLVAERAAAAAGNASR